MKVSAKWKIAALVLVTWPLAVWLIGQNFRSPASKLLLVVASSPLLIAAGIELYAMWRQASVHPESYVEGSPTGNKIAVVLAFVLIGCVLWAAYSLVRQHT